MLAIPIAALALTLATAPAADDGVASPDATAETVDPPAPAEPPVPRLNDADVVVPDLGAVRYHDPRARREVWLGVDGGGVVVPGATSDLGRRVWTAYAAPTWAVGLLPRLAIGGRHRITWYDAGNIRLRVHEHMLSLSGRMLRHRPRLRDRPAVGFEVHDVRKSIVEGVDFRLGGIRDVVMFFGYGLEHDLTDRLQLAWRAEVRQVWVFLDTQRQARLALRLGWLPRPRHRLAFEALGYFVNRDEDQAGQPIDRNTVHGQAQVQYTWLSRAGVGPTVGARYTTSFLSGEAPIYELRTESLRTNYGEVFAGLRLVWR